MAHSFIGYKDVGRHVDDAKIALVVYATLAHAATRRAQGLLGPLEPLLRRWETVIDDCGPGCIDLELDAHLATDVDRQAFIDLVTDAEGRILAYADPSGRVDVVEAISPISEQAIRFLDKLSVKQIGAAFTSVLSVLAPPSALPI